MTMLRNGDHAWLMYLRYNGDSGIVSHGDPHVPGTCSYTLSNGQVDEYPLSWCIGVDRCLKAITCFFVNEGTLSDFVSWQQV
jgi:hypothetical protein